MSAPDSKPEEKSEITQQVTSPFTPPKEIEELSQANLQDDFKYQGMQVAAHAIRKEMLAIQANVNERSKKIQAFMAEAEKGAATKSATKPIPDEGYTPAAKPEGEPVGGEKTADPSKPTEPPKAA